jgi:hypothetical protein
LIYDITRKILAMRKRSYMDEQRAKAQQKADALEKQEEMRIEHWLKNWEYKRTKRAQEVVEKVTKI